MKNTRKIPTLVGILVLVIGLAAAVALLRFSAIFGLKASPDTAPQEVTISNITDNSFTVSWTSDQPTTSTINWGTSASLGTLLPTDNAALKNVHFFTVRSLSPNKKYFFKIVSGGTSYDDNGTLWEVQTAPSSSTALSTSVISGNIVDQSSAPVPNALVYVDITGVSPLSAKTSANGNWVLPLSLARSATTLTPMNLPPTTTLQIAVVSGPNGFATATANLAAANPVPTIKLGESHFFDSQSASDTQAPSSSVTTSTTSGNLSSRINLGSTSTTSAVPKTVTLKSVVEGEIVNTQSPEFFGDGPPGTSIIITVESDPQTQNIVVPQSGAWSWSPPNDLPPGTHTVTLSWKDAASGIVQKITKSFIVSAASEGPSFEATPGATPKATTSPVATSGATPIATSSATASATPRVSIPSTESGIPVSGSTTTTIAFIAAGIICIITGLFVATSH